MSVCTYLCQKVKVNWRLGFWLGFFFSILKKYLLKLFISKTVWSGNKSLFSVSLNLKSVPRTVCPKEGIPRQVLFASCLGPLALPSSKQASSVWRYARELVSLHTPFPASKEFQYQTHQGILPAP